MTESITPAASSSLATKYRPLLLKDMIGQTVLKNQIAGILRRPNPPCALLLTGATGTGKTTTARVIARHINKVRECTPINDIFEYNIGTNGTVEDIRELASKIHYMPKNKSHKSIYILDEVHKLTKNSASALLKEIEEPPAHAMFILCTNEPDKLLDTLLNRCEKLELKPYTEEEILALLRHVCTNEAFDIKDEILKKIALMGNYQPRECLVSLQGISNVIAGGKNLSPEDLEARINESVKSSIFEYSNTFLVALYMKNHGAYCKRIEECGDVDSLISVSLATNRSLVKFFSCLNSKYQIKLSYGATKVKDMLATKLKDLSVDQIADISTSVHRVLTETQIVSRSTTTNTEDVLYSKINEHLIRRA